MTPYTGEQLKALLARPSSEDLSEWRTWAAVDLIARAGIRLFSTIHLRWPDIDLDKKVCIFCHTKTNEQYVPLPMMLLFAS